MAGTTRSANYDVTTATSTTRSMYWLWLPVFATMSIKKPGRLSRRRGDGGTFSGDFIITEPEG